MKLFNHKDLIAQSLLMVWLTC